MRLWAAPVGRGFAGGQRDELMVVLVMKFNSKSLFMVSILGFVEVNRTYIRYDEPVPQYSNDII